MKLKIVQPEVEKKDDDVIELWLEYTSLDNVWLCSRKGDNVAREIRIDTSGDICAQTDGCFKHCRSLQSNDNLRSIYS